MSEKGTNGVFLNLIMKGAQDAQKQAKELSNGIKTAQKELSLMMVNLRKMASIVKRTTDYTDDYVSSVRLMTTTFAETSKEISGFVETMSGMIGLDEALLTRQVALFKQLGKSIHLTDKNSTELAKGLTTLSAKMAILYNKDYGVMATALQRAIQGTQETLKAMTGIEATEMAQQLTLTNNGINRQVSSLNEAERSIVMYASILKQVTSTNKTYEDAVNSVAWQKQMLTAQVKRLGVAIGSVLYPVLQRLLPIFNAILMVLTEIITIFARMIGVSLDSSNSINGSADAYENLANGIAAAGSAAKKQLRGFDKLNNITTPSSGGGGNALGIDKNILKLLDQVDDGFFKIKNKATEIKEQIMQWLGFIKKVDEHGNTIGWEYGGLQETIKNLSKWWKELNTQSKIFVGLGVALAIYNIWRAVKTLSKILGVTGLLKVFRNFATLITTKVIPKLATLLASFGKMITASQTLQVALAGAAGVVIAFVALDAGFTSLAKDGPTVANVIQIISGAIAACTTAVYLLSTAFGALNVVTGGIGIAIGLAVTAIMGIITALGNEKIATEEVINSKIEFNNKLKELEATAQQNMQTTIAQSSRAEELKNKLL